MSKIAVLASSHKAARDYMKKNSIKGMYVVNAQKAASLDSSYKVVATDCAGEHKEAKKIAAALKKAGIQK
jgi:predicted secreted protein